MSPLAPRPLVFFLPVICCVCMGCATTRPPAVPSGPEAVVVDSAEEVQVGRSMAQLIIAPRYAPWNNSVEQRRLNAIGRKIATASDRPGIVYHLQIFDSPDYDAFALPGGYVYLSRGLYQDLDADGRAAIVAHEIAHVAAHHAVKRMQSVLGDEVFVGLVLAGVGQKDPRVLRMVAGASDAVFDFLGRGYGRQDELEADALAVKYLARAGYDPYVLADTLEFLMKEKKKAGKVFEILNAPVRMSERIRKSRKEAKDARAGLGF